MEPTDRVQLSQRQVDNVRVCGRSIFQRSSLLQEVRYAADAFTAWHLDNTFDMDKFRKNFKVISFFCFCLRLGSPGVRSDQSD